MKTFRRFISMLLIAIPLSFASAAELPIFPGAQGFGTHTQAGRGGKILKVTNINDCGEGSLRKALEAEGARIVVFEVSGTIKLDSDICIRNPFITIAGQSAPSPGITLRGAGLKILTHDVLVQHLRIRVGDCPDGPSPTNRDALQILGPEAFNVVVDHISASWAIDENVSTWYPLHDVTISNSIISEALHRSSHPKGPHSKGLLVGTSAKRVSIIRNLLAHNHERNPRINGDTSVIVVNNLFYNACNHSFCAIGSGDGPFRGSLVGNIFIKGENTKADKAIKIQKDSPSGTEIYISDNLYDGGIEFVDSSQKAKIQTSPILIEDIKILKSNRVEVALLGNSGARPRDRDAVDRRIISEVKDRKGRIINSPNEAGGWPVLAERRHSLAIPENPHQTGESGYSRIEEYLHSLSRALEYPAN